MLKQKLSSIFAVMMVCLASACTGGLNGTPASSKSGGFVITPGDQIEVDLSDLAELGFSSDLTISLKRATDDYKSTTTLLDLTSFITSNPTANNKYKLILPKDIAGIRPMVLLVEAPSLRAQFTDVFYADTTSSKPGIASSLAYELLKYYPGKTLSSFSSTDYTGIKGLIQARIDEVKAQTETLSLASVRFDRVMRFYKNSLAFYPTFLDAVSAFGIQYTYTLVSPDGLLAADTPEGSLANYQFASLFKVGGVVAQTNPFNQVNNPTRLSTATPGLGKNIAAQEGTQISLTASPADPDDDFIDKSFIIQFMPRVLPKHLPAGVDPLHLVLPEPTPSYVVKATGGKSTDPAIYTSDLIQYNEALNKSNYKKGILGTTDCDPNDTDTDCGDTAFRNVYLLVTDGMVRVPYRWNFKYVDVNRAPKIIADQYQHVNDTTLDDVAINAVVGATSATTYGAIAAIDGAASPGTFRQHASHCETDPDILEQNVRSRADGPWGCVFRTYDPDLDDDPNAAMDEYYYTVENYESSTEIMTNGLKISPSTTGAKTVKGARLASCVDYQGKTHRQCGLGHYSITVDNSVKVAAATKASLEYSYDVVVTDRPENGFRAAKTISRKIKFTPIPPRFVNFENRAKPAPLPEIGRTYSAADHMSDPTKQESTYARSDIYMEEILANAKAASTDASSVGFKETLFSAMNRPAFEFTTNGESAASSSYMTQPRQITDNTATFDNDANLLSFHAPVTRMLGNLLFYAYPAPSPAPTDPTMRPYFLSNGKGVFEYDPATQNTYDASSYSYPREYDRTCELDSNNTELNGSNDAIWDQRPVRLGSAIWVNGGWTFEFDVVDLDNLDLRASEPYEPVYLNVNHDANSFGISGQIQYCDHEMPNPDANNYQTYTSTTAANGTIYPWKNADTCKGWLNSPPQTMQPISVYYDKLNDDGSHQNRKMVYHRVRMKWAPKDHAAVTNFIKNHLTSFMIYGDRYKAISNKSDLEALQDKTDYSNIEMVAARKNHKPCASFAQDSFNNRYLVLHDANPVTSDMLFNVKDENRQGESGNGSATVGRYQAEVVPVAANTASLLAIDQVPFSRFAPFINNCTSPTAPTALADAKPLVWYAGADKLPRARMTARLSSSPMVEFPFCLRYAYSAYREPSAPNRIFDKVALFQATAPTTLNLTTFTNSGNPCFTESSITFSANENYALLATPCSGISYSSGGVTGTTLADFNPTLAANGSFPVGTDLRLKFFPPFYGADYGTPNENTLMVNVSGVDSFIYDTTTGLNRAIDVLSSRVNTTVAANLGPATIPLSGMSSSALFGYVDWDHQPTALSLAQAPTPTPVPATNVFYRVNSSGVLQIFSKGTSPATVPLQALDLLVGAGLPAAGIESDPFDAFQYVNLQPLSGQSGANSAPAFATPTGRTSCIDAPTGSGAGFLSNVLSGSLSFAAIEQFRRCNFTWTPAAADVGKKYSYQFSVQDNWGATADSNNVPTSTGVGARHPAGISPNTGFYIQNDSWATTHGPYATFNVQLESIEQNLAPYFVDDSGTSNAQRYCTAVSTSTGCTASSRSAGWVTVFGGSGLQPSCSASSGYACPANISGESIQEGDVLQSTVAVDLTEGATTNISILVRDDNVTSALKNAFAAPPRKVLVVNKAGSSVKSYSVPSFATMSLGVTSTAQSDGKTSTVFSFDWKPSDAEAHQLSNADGFLIPFVVSDNDYIPANDAGFPDAFKVQKITRTIWIWATAKVKNNPPMAYYIDPVSSLEIPLSGATLTFETGLTKSYTIRIKDTDRARYDIDSDTLPFTAVASSKPAFVNAPGTLGALQSSGIYLYQEFTLTNTALTPTDIGMYNYDLKITDPGDPSKCWVDGNSGSCTNNVRANIADSGVGFNIQVVGKPFFLVPHTDTDPAQNRNNANAYVYSSSSPTILNYPLALSISKNAEKGGQFFFGINSTASATIPMRTTVPPASTPIPTTAKGIYINERGVVKWPDATFDRVGATLSVPIQAVLSSYCGSGTNVTLYRFNESSNSIETCKLSSAVASANAASETLNIKVYNNYDVPPLANLSSTAGIRITNHAVASSPLAQAEATAQYSAFKGRCQYCANTPTASGASPSGFALNTSGASGQVHFSLSNFENDFLYAYNGSSNLTVTRTYGDNQASTINRITSFSVLKGDTASFSGTVSSVPSVHSHYRWYVNGCLKKAGDIGSTNITFDLPISILMSGLNNDCTGEYSINETDSGKLATLKVRLNIVNNIENTTSTSDGATKTYLWNVTVLNNKPNIQPGISIAAFTGNQPVTLALPITYNAKSYLAYADVNSSAGTSVRLHEILSTGDINSSAMVSTQSTITSQPTTLGIQTTPSLMVAMNNTTTYPSSSSEASTIFKTSSRSFGATFNGSSFDSWNIAQAYNDVAGYSVFSQYKVSSLPSNFFQTSAGVFDSSSATNFYLIDGQDGYGYRAIRQYWQNNINSGASIYGGDTSPLSNGSSGVRKNIVSNSNLFQLIGAKSGSANGAVSSINIRSLSASGSTLSSSNIKKINFSSSGSAPDCPFDGTPLDGNYVAAVDTLFVLAYGNTGIGKLLAITNATNSSASCSVIANVANPSLNNYEFNPNTTKSALDTASNVVIGIINRSGGQGAQAYYIDAYSSKVYTQDLSNTINPAALIYSKETNSVQILDGDKTGSKTPTLYKIW